MNNNIPVIGITILFIISAVTPIVIGYNVGTTNNEMLVKNYKLDRYLYPEFYDCYNIDEISNYKQYNYDMECPVYDNVKLEEVVGPEESPHLFDGPMDSPWPMHGHDTRHTGCSSYSTVDTWDEVWKFETWGPAEGGPVIDKDGTIYIGAYSLYAIYPDGSLKWKFDTIFTIRSAPAIDENGIIYFGIIYGEPNYLYATYLNGSLKWKYSIGELNSIFSSPAIGNDGTIYFGSEGGYPPTGSIWALNPDGSLKWKYNTNHVVYSSPAIGLDGIIFCGSHDGNVYALYPNNGTLKWKYNTGSWVHGSPTIGDDGTVYIGSDNGYLYAFYPDNGTIKWSINIGCMRASPTLDEDGTLYFGVWEKKFYAIYPNGTIKWVFYPGAKIWGSSAALSADGTLYFGTCDLEWTGGIEIIALYTDGTVKWRKGLDTVFSSPAIGEDGTVYIGSCGPPGEGFLNAFGIGELKADANGPYYGLIDEPLQFTGSHWGGISPHSYHWDFGDGNTSDEQNPSYMYTSPMNYTVTLTVTDNESNTAVDTTYAWIQDGNTPPNKPNIDGPTNGAAGTSYPYTFTATDPEGAIIWYYIDWGDNTNTGWIGPYDSGKEVTKSHSWSEEGTYTIKCKAKDPYDEEGPWGELEVTMPRNKATTSSLFHWFLERFPLLDRFLTLLVI